MFIPAHAVFLLKHFSMEVEVHSWSGQVFIFQRKPLVVESVAKVISREIFFFILCEWQ